MVKIFVGNIQEGSRTDELRTMFEKYGPVSECDILSNFGFVHMDDENDAKAAVKGLDGAMFSGSAIKVEMSHGKSRGGGRGGPRGGRGGMRGGRGGMNGGGRGGPPRDRGYGGGGYMDRGARGGADPYDRDVYRDRDMYRPRADPYARDPYERDPFPYDRRMPPRDPYERRAPRDMYSMRDPYGPPRDPYVAPRTQYPFASRDPYARERSPIGRALPINEYSTARRTYSSAYEMAPRAVSPPPARRY